MSNETVQWFMNESVDVGDLKILRGIAITLTVLSGLQFLGSCKGGDEEDKKQKASTGSNIFGLVPPILGMIGLYLESGTPIHVYNCYKAFIALALIGCIFGAIAVLGTFSVLLCTAEGRSSLSAKLVALCASIVMLISCALSIVTLVFGWKYAFGAQKIVEL